MPYNPGFSLALDLPNPPFEVKVGGIQAESARQLIAEAQKAGPIAAEAAEEQFDCEHMPYSCRRPVTILSISRHIHRLDDDGPTPTADETP